MRVGACSRIVARFNTWWAFLGWTFFIGSYVLRFGTGTLLPLAVLCFFLMVVWWIIDVVDRTVPAWQIAAGIAMFVLSFVGCGPFLIVAWIVYWFRVRE